MAATRRRSRLSVFWAVDIEDIELIVPRVGGMGVSLRRQMSKPTTAAADNERVLVLSAEDLGQYSDGRALRGEVMYRRRKRKAKL